MKKIFRFINLALFAWLGICNNVQGQNVPNLSSTSPFGVTATFPQPPEPNMPYGQNYIRSFAPVVPVTNVADVAESPNVREVMTSRDGFNRTYQTVKMNHTLTESGRKTLVSIADIRWRKSQKSFLPYAADSGQRFRYIPFQEQRAFYNSLYGTEGYTSFSEAVAISDPSSRSSISYAPGKTQIGQNRGTTVKFITNTASQIRLWKLSAGLPVSTAYYAANELTGEEVTGIQGSRSRSFMDKDGRIVYKAELLEGTTEAITQYVYGDMGQLLFTITPNVSAMATGTPSAAVVDNLCFQYQYDNLGRLKAERKPGEAAFTEIVYDRKDRVVMRRSPLEATMGKWEVTYYDPLGRVIATSLFSSTQTQVYWQGQVDATLPTATVATSNLLYYIGTNKGEGVYPTVAITGNEVMSYSLYDHYNHGAIASVFGDTYDAASFPDPPLGTESVPRSLRTHGMPTGSKIRIIKAAGTGDELGDWVETVNYYDTKGRLIQQRSLNATKNGAVVGKETVCNYYDFTGKLLQSDHHHENRKTLHAASEYTRYIYDAATGQLLETAHKMNEGTWKLLNKFWYDDLGRVSRKSLGNYAEVQDFKYNIRGQLTGMNANYAETGNKGSYSRSFGESLKYDFGFSSVRFDGKTTGMVWRGSGGTTEKAKGYGYSYDLAGRLKVADFHELTGSTWSRAATDYSVSNLAYDANGNMKGMKQRGMGLVASAIAPVDMDRLEYVYEDNSNRLARVFDTATDYNLGDFKNSPTNVVDYDYDASGNLKKDVNKDITSVVYTWFNKPQVITFGNGNTIKYTYDAAGNKLQELVTIGSTPPKRTDYVGNFIYENDVLKYVNTAEGRTTYDPPSGSYKEEFFVKDHLGNVRSVVDLLNRPISTYLATYEIASAGLEGLMFDNVSEIAEGNPLSPDPDDMQSGMLNGSIANRRVGTSLLMRVMAGDRVEMNVNSFYESYNPATDAPVNATTMLSSIVGTLTAGSGGMGGSESHNPQLVGQLFNGSNFTTFDNIVNSSTEASKPKAYLNYVLFSENMQIIGTFSGAYQANGLGTWGEIGTSEPMEIPANGFLAIYISNRSISNVYFDKLTLRVERGRLLEETHYYPHGLPMGNIGSTAVGHVPNRVKHQGNEYIKDAGLNWMDFNFRQYDPQIGRFLGVDPLAASGGQDRFSPYAAMGNQPETAVDPNGLMFEGAASPHFIRAGVLDMSWMEDYILSSQHFNEAMKRSMSFESLQKEFWNSFAPSPAPGSSGEQQQTFNLDAIAFVCKTLKPGTSIHMGIYGDGKISTNYMSEGGDEGIDYVYNGERIMRTQTNQIGYNRVVTLNGKGEAKEEFSVGNSIIKMESLYGGHGYTINVNLDIGFSLYKWLYKRANFQKHDEFGVGRYFEWSIVQVVYENDNIMNRIATSFSIHEERVNASIPFDRELAENNLRNNPIKSYIHRHTHVNGSHNPSGGYSGGKWDGDVGAYMRFKDVLGENKFQSFIDQ